MAFVSVFFFFVHSIHNLGYCSSKRMAKINASLHFLFLFLSSTFLHLSSTVELGFCFGSPNVSCTEIEREALVSFKEGLTDPSGRLSSWVGQDCFKWRGVTCSLERVPPKVIKLKLRNQYAASLDADENVTGAVGDNYGAAHALGGQISHSLIVLTDLRYLDLSMNDFGGLKIPKFFGSFKRLRYLNLSGASFVGTIPPHLGNLSKLRHLDLNSYSLQSVENDLLWLSRLSSLRYLNLGNVNLSRVAAHWFRAVNSLSSLVELHLPGCALSSLPDFTLQFGNITSLSVLDLSSNEFSSSITPWLLNFSSLAYLDLSNNNLQGSVPDGFGYLTSLKHIDLSSNFVLEGPLPKNFGKLCNLQTLKLSFNRISGEITELVDGLSECVNSSSLETLDLGFNDLSGFLPNSLGKLHNLKYLWLWNNSFVGSIPSSIGNLTLLEELYLSDNKMNGTIPETLGQLSELVAVDLSNNPLTGVITEAHLSNLTSLKEFSNYRTTGRIFSLVFNISPEWIPPFRLSLLRIKSCHMGPKFPAWLRNQTELTSVVLNDAGIAGNIPDWFWNLDLHLNELDVGSNNLSGSVPNSLKFLPGSSVDLSENNFQGPLLLWSSNITRLCLCDNFFSGPIPPDFGDRMPMLTDLDLSGNAINGTIPLSFGKLNNLMFLVISKNQLSGEIPEFWNGLPDLYAIDMNNNNLSGELPTSMGSLRYLRFLMVSNNCLSGELPSALQNWTIIHTLDLGGNRFSGNVPAWIGEAMPELQILRLRSNVFHGRIPSQLCTLSSLHILDLGDNNLFGPIPSCVGNLSGMTSEADMQRYEGELMVLMKNREDLYENILYLVNSMDLSNNNLSGEVPEGMTNLVGLGTLNLSMNHLTGKIPDGIGSLKHLETLDLSRNQLSGVIPPGMASLTSLNHLNLSYNNLSGRIPTGNQLQTLNDPSIYGNNPALCGPPTTAKCPGDDGNPRRPARDDEGRNEDGHESDAKWFYVSMAAGFVVGFWGVCGSLVVKDSWRHAYFRLVFTIKEWMLLVIQLNVARIRRKLKLGRSRDRT